MEEGREPTTEEMLVHFDLICPFKNCPTCRAIRTGLLARDKLKRLKELADKILMATGKCDDCPLLQDVRNSEEGK